ncbi:MAG: transposase [Acidobacteria bacterium RIFCSPLOWO2_12_FULL_54_10]|nr:MAG: transposase [Acidobacteria bacterium RIFCSPLOWO2_12_FULL_54_10]
MGQILHRCARTTEALRRAIQDSQESIAALAARYGLNPKTVHKWKRRKFTHDAAMGPKAARSTVLTSEEEAIVVAFRKMTLLPLDDCLYALQSSIPALTRSALHRCFQRHGISRLPDRAGDKPAMKKFQAYPIGYFHIDIAEVHTEEGRLYLFVAIDRTSKFAFAELHDKATRRMAANFLHHLVEAVPYKIHAILTGNGLQFTELAHFRKSVREKPEIENPHGFYLVQAFDYACEKHGIEHRLTKVRHPWTNGQVERRNRTIQDATVKKYYYQSRDELKQRLHAFLLAYNFAKRLNVIKGLTAYEYICKVWTNEPVRFRINPLHLTVGLNS